MSNIVKKVLMILVIMGVLGYLLLRYMNGGFQSSYFFVIGTVLSYLLITLVQGLVEDIRNK